MKLKSVARLLGRLMPALALTAIMTLSSSQLGAITTTTTYNFSGQCTDCNGTATAQLTLLSSYVLGTSITTSNFVSFHYDGTNLISAFTINLADVGFLSGSLPATLPGPATLSVIDTTFFGFDSGITGQWNVGGDDFGTLGVYSLAGATTGAPEPGTLGVMGAGLGLLGFAARRKLRR